MKPPVPGPPLPRVPADGLERGPGTSGCSWVKAARAVCQAPELCSPGLTRFQRGLPGKVRLQGAGSRVLFGTSICVVSPGCGGERKNQLVIIDTNALSPKYLLQNLNNLASVQEMTYHFCKSSQIHLVLRAFVPRAKLLVSATRVIPMFTCYRFQHV